MSGMERLLSKWTKMGRIGKVGIVLLSAFLGSSITLSKNVDHRFAPQEILLVKELIDTAFSKTYMAKRYAVFSKEKKIYVLCIDSLQIDKSWNRVPHNGNYDIEVSTSEDDYPYILFSKLKVMKNRLKLEFTTYPSSITAVGVAKKNLEGWDLDSLLVGIR